MRVGFVGTDHTRSSLVLRERLAVAGEPLDLLLARLRADPLIDEAAILSSCNRIEVYVAAFDVSAALDRAAQHLLDVTGVPPLEAADALQPSVDAAAIRHLCAVAAGLCSLVVGETQVLAQVREAFAYAAQQATAGPELQALARTAVLCGKKVRTETAFGATDTSVSAVVVEMARRRLGALHDRSALLVGAGRINEESARLLHGAGIGELVVVSRTRAAAAHLAAAHGGRDASIDDLPRLLGDADLAIAATRAPRPPIIPATLLPRDATRPLLLFDIAVPRDVDPAVGTLAGVELVDMDALRPILAPGGDTPDAITEAWAIVDLQVEAYLVATRVRQAAPLITRLRAHVDRQKDAELARTMAGLAHLAGADRDAVALMAQRLVNRMFHHLATRLKAAAIAPDGDAYLAALSFLFDETGIEDPSPHAGRGGEGVDKQAERG